MSFNNKGGICMVSVIVPVYNVEKYLDKCLESIVNQSYRELEILIMEGQSTDKSLQICKKWEKIDSRIIVVSRKDGGLGPARNYGINMASGEFIFFVDSDDYLHKNAIENLIAKFDEELLDFVVGGYRSIDINGKKQESFLPLESGCNEIIQNVESRKKYIRRGYVAVWGKLYRSSFLKKNHIEMPASLAEDLAVFPIIVYKARKIKCINEIVYFYRKEREDSGSRNITSIIPIYKVIDVYCNYFKKVNIFEEYKVELFFLSRIHLTSWLDWFKKQLVIEEYQKIEKIYMKKLDEFFGKDSLKKYTTIFPIGSYNVRFECKQVQAFEVTKRHSPFTGTVAQFYDTNISNTEIFHKNKFRNECLIHDKEKLVKEYINNPHYIFNEIVIDFMDDVNGIVCLEDGCIMSNTEIFKEADKPGIKIKEIISYESTCYWEMWKKSCLNFINYIKQNTCKIILVKNRYTTKYEDENGMHNFENRELIDKKNLYIEKMEKYFLENCNKNVYLVDIDEKKLYSDKYFTYGCSEKYLSMSGRIDVAEKIIDIINSV